MTGSFQTEAKLSDSWKARDPIHLFECELEVLGLLTPAEIETIGAAADAEIRDGVAFAEASPLPSADELLRDVSTPLGQL